MAARILERLAQSPNKVVRAVGLSLAGTTVAVLAGCGNSSAPAGTNGWTVADEVLKDSYVSQCPPKYPTPAPGDVVTTIAGQKVSLRPAIDAGASAAAKIAAAASQVDVTSCIKPLYDAEAASLLPNDPERAASWNALSKAASDKATAAIGDQVSGQREFTNIVTGAVNGTSPIASELTKAEDLRSVTVTAIGTAQGTLARVAIEAGIAACDNQAALDAVTGDEIILGQKCDPARFNLSPTRTFTQVVLVLAPPDGVNPERSLGYVARTVPAVVANEHLQNGLVAAVDASAKVTDINGQLAEARVPAIVDGLAPVPATAEAMGPAATATSASATQASAAAKLKAYALDGAAHAQTQAALADIKSGGYQPAPPWDPRMG